MSRMTTQQERRRFPRRSIDRGCKVFRIATRQYAAARTCDVSEGGAMLVVEGDFAIGDRLDLVIAWDWETVLPATALMPARVVRTEPGRVAIAFEETAVMAA
jgi:hypothetical protein